MDRLALEVDIEYQHSTMARAIIFHKDENIVAKVHLFQAIFVHLKKVYEGQA
jgi:hypothetical protein